MYSFVDDLIDLLDEWMRIVFDVEIIFCILNVILKSYRNVIELYLVHTSKHFPVVFYVDNSCH